MARCPRRPLPVAGPTEPADVDQYRGRRSDRPADPHAGVAAAARRCSGRACRRRGSRSSRSKPVARIGDQYGCRRAPPESGPCAPSSSPRPVPVNAPVTARAPSPPPSPMLWARIACVRRGARRHDEAAVRDGHGLRVGQAPPAGGSPLRRAAEPGGLQLRSARRKDPHAADTGRRPADALRAIPIACVPVVSTAEPLATSLSRRPRRRRSGRRSRSKPRSSSAPAPSPTLNTPSPPAAADALARRVAAEVTGRLKPCSVLVDADRGRRPARPRPCPPIVRVRFGVRRRGTTDHGRRRCRRPPPMLCAEQPIRGAVPR